MSARPDSAAIKKPEQIPRVKISIDLNRIKDSIFQLKKWCSFTASDEKSAPRYRNEAATLHLHLETKGVFKNGLLKKILLEHPLSYKRDLCVIARHMEKQAQRAQVEKILTKIGVDGKIKLFPLSLVNQAVDENDSEALNELVELYDTHLVKEVPNLPPLTTALKTAGKRLVLLDMKADDLEEEFRRALATVHVFAAEAGDSFSFKVGNLGMSTEQVDANIRSALDQVQSKGFREGLVAFHTIGLTTGNPEAPVVQLCANSEGTSQADREEDDTDDKLLPPPEVTYYFPGVQSARKPGGKKKSSARKRFQHKQGGKPY